MRDLTKSIFSFSWAMSLFGLRQMGALLAPRNGTSALDAVTRCTEDQLGSLLRPTFRAGDNLQRGLIDLMFSFLTLGAWNPNSMMRTGADAMQRSAQAGANAMQWSAQAAGQAAQAAAAAAAPGMQAMGGMGRVDWAQPQRSGWAQPSGTQASAGWGPMPSTGA